MAWDCERIRELRHAYGQTQAEFCKPLGVVVGTLRMWEQGAGVPGGSARKLLDRLAEDIGFDQTIRETVQASAEGSEVSAT